MQAKPIYRFTEDKKGKTPAYQWSRGRWWKVSLAQAQLEVAMGTARDETADFLATQEKLARMSAEWAA